MDLLFLKEAIFGSVPTWASLSLGVASLSVHRLFESKSLFNKSVGVLTSLITFGVAILAGQLLGFGASDHFSWWGVVAVVLAYNGFVVHAPKYPPRKDEWGYRFTDGRRQSSICVPIVLAALALIPSLTARYDESLKPAYQLAATLSPCPEINPDDPTFEQQFVAVEAGDSRIPGRSYLWVIDNQGTWFLFDELHQTNTPLMLKLQAVARALKEGFPVVTLKLTVKTVSIEGREYQLEQICTIQKKE